MTSTAAAASAAKRTGPERVTIGAFGWPEPSRQVKACPLGDCDSGLIAATDLYCTSHDRLLPFVRDWTNAGRVTAAVAGTALIYGLFELAGVLNSWVPVFIVYAMIGLGGVGLPLRLFPLTIRLTILVWFAACVGTLTYHITGPHFHAIMLTTLTIVAACALGLHAGVLSVQGALAEEGVNNHNHRPKAVLAFVTSALVVFAAAGIAALSLLLVPESLLLDDSRLMRFAVITAIAAAAAALLGAVVAGLIDGAPRVSLETTGFPAWRGPEPVTWRAEPTAIRHRRVHTIVDRMGEVLRKALIRLADALRILSVASARATVNLLLTAARISVNSLIRSVNFVFKLIVILLRGIVAGLLSAWWFCSNAADLAISNLLYAVVAAGLPVAALFVAAGLTTAAAGDTRTYLISGSLAALLHLGIRVILGITALTLAWITLASQSVRESLQSASRSAMITIPYALILVAAGGWIVGIPGTLGYGPIHVGWVTLVSTSALVISLVWSQFIRKTQDESEADRGFPSMKAGRSEG
jgi:hypothetical protein